MLGEYLIPIICCICTGLISFFLCENLSLAQDLCRFLSALCLTMRVFVSTFSSTYKWSCSQTRGETKDQFQQVRHTHLNHTHHFSCIYLGKQYVDKNCYHFMVSQIQRCSNFTLFRGWIRSGMGVVGSRCHINLPAVSLVSSVSS